MQQFTHKQGESHLYQLAPFKSDNLTPGATSTDVAYSVDNPAIASVTPNTSVSQNLQATIGFLAPGSAIVTSTGTDEAGNPFSTQVEFIVTPATPLLTDHFVWTEIS